MRHFLMCVSLTNVGWSVLFGSRPLPSDSRLRLPALDLVGVLLMEASAMDLKAELERLQRNNAELEMRARWKDTDQSGTGGPQLLPASLIALQSTRKLFLYAF